MLVQLFCFFAFFTLSYGQTLTSGALTTSQKQALLDRHNRYRNETAQGLTTGISGYLNSASNMNFLFWDDAVADVAQNYSNYCNFAHNGQRSNQFWGFKQYASFIPPSSVYLGENIAYSSTKSPTISTLLGLIDSFYSEHSSYNNVAINSTNYATFGHYTQLVWASTRYLGCGFAICSWGSFLVCDYYPGGNYIGQYPYTSGTCSSSTCNKDRTITCINSLCGGCMDPAYTKNGSTSRSTSCTNGLGVNVSPTVSPTTASPTTASPTTSSPTTAAPTTKAPTTASPTTAAPTTAAPTTAAPTTKAPTTSAPTTAAPTTAAPTTAAPTTAAPTTAAPTTKAPTTASPTTASPTTAAPTTASPTTASPTTTAPTTAAPTTKAPTTKAPTTATPTTKAPTTASPTTASPTTASPTTASPTTASPTTASPTTASPTTASPTTKAPTTTAPTVPPTTTASPTASPTTTASPTDLPTTTASPTVPPTTTISPTFSPTVTSPTLLPTILSSTFAPTLVPTITLSPTKKPITPSPTKSRVTRYFCVNVYIYFYYYHRRILLSGQTDATQTIADLTQTTILSLISAQNVDSSSYNANSTWNATNSSGGTITLVVNTNIVTSDNTAGTELQSLLINNQDSFSESVSSSLTSSSENNTTYSIYSVNLDVSMSTSSTSSNNEKQTASLTNISSYGIIQWVILVAILLAIIFLIIGSIFLYRRCKNKKEESQVHINPQSLPPTGWPQVMPSDKLETNFTQTNIVPMETEEDENANNKTLPSNLKIQQNLSNNNSLQKSSVIPPPKFSQFALPTVSNGYEAESEDNINQTNFYNSNTNEKTEVKVQAAPPPNVYANNTNIKRPPPPPRRQ